MRKIYIVNYREYDVFISDTYEILAVNSWDDADWRGEYFDHIFKSYNIEILEMSLEELNDKQKDKILEYTGDDEFCYEPI